MARDLAKFGQLYANGGVWEGQRILSEDWVQASTRPYLKLRPHSYDWYGYFFRVREKWRVGGRTLRVFYASGLGDNKIFVFPDESLVVVITSDAYGEPYSQSKVVRLMERILLPALTRTASP